MNEIAIIADGKKISGWTKVTVRRTMAELCDSFNFNFSDKWGNEFPPLYDGLPCQVKIDDIPVVTGYIDEIEPEITPDSVLFMLAGRSKTMDLVDCNRIESPYSWSNQNILNLAKNVCSPHGINVTLNGVVGDIFAEASIDQNESLFDFLQKFAKKRQLLTLSGTDGNLILTNAGNEKAVDSFIEGQNIPTIKGKFSWTNRFSEYVIKGQQKVKAKAESWGGKTIAIYSKAVDENVTRFRPKMFTGDTQITTSDAQKQVNWEAQVRAGRSHRFSIVVPNWVQSNGKLWKENLTTYVKHSGMRLDGNFLIESVDYSLDTNAQFCTLNFVLPSTYTINPKDIIKKQKAKSGKYGWSK